MTTHCPFGHTVVQFELSTKLAGDIYNVYLTCYLTCFTDILQSRRQSDPRQNDLGTPTFVSETSPGPIPGERVTVDAPQGHGDQESLLTGKQGEDVY